MSWQAAMAVSKGKLRIFERLNGAARGPPNYLQRMEENGKVQGLDMGLDMGKDRLKHSNKRWAQTKDGLKQRIVEIAMPPVLAFLGHVRRVRKDFQW